jgi:hypothetical protein
MIRYYCIYILLIFTSLFPSCSNKNKDAKWNKLTEETVGKFAGKTMNFADTLVRISYGTLDSAFIFSGNHPVLKVIVYVDGTCGTCLLDLNVWQSIATKVYQKRKDCFFYIFVNWWGEVNQTNNPLLEMGFPYSWYLDRKCSFFSSYEIYDKRFQAVLLDEKNKLLLIGSPSLNPKLGELYLETILTYKK